MQTRGMKLWWKVVTAIRLILPCFMFPFTFIWKTTCALLNGHSFNAHTQQIVLHISDAYSFFYARMYSTYIQQATHLTNFPAAKNFIFFSPMNLLSSHPEDRVGTEVDSNSRGKNLSNVWRSKKNRQQKHTQVSSQINHHAWIGNDKNLLRFVFLDNWIAI